MLKNINLFREKIVFARYRRYCASHSRNNDIAIIITIIISYNNKVMVGNNVYIHNYRV